MPTIDDAPATGDGRRTVRIALVNNMPDAAFLDTEDQFRRVTAAGDPDSALELYAISAIARSQPIASVIASRYRGLDELTARPPDALIVTGTEPRWADLTAEPAWPALTGLLRWATDAVGTVLLSCLASHASVLCFDGVERTRRPDGKCSGILRGVVHDPRDPLAAGLGPEVAVPHSRVNEIPEDVMRELGYRIVVGGASAADGWSVAAREQGRALFVLCQGHPEYDTLTLLREHRRDVRRHLLGESPGGYPSPPAGYLSAAGRRRLWRFAAHTRSDTADPAALAARFPFSELATEIPNPWAEASRTLYGNWISVARAEALAVA